MLAEEYSEAGISAARVRFEDFVPNDDDYLGRVAGAARRILAGEDPGPVF